ncbi:protein inturned [Drosophila subpulchrella]|uniref:protein inturned n=1 Tax=Drosophila subpulchrella TaxID=1486046 RepID=UPI0018A18D2E|nr:protein inturned [Drosophila subpulchrella]
MRKSPGSLASEAFSSSNSSLSNSYSDASDLANWEEYVATDGSLFYMEYVRNAKTGGSAERRVEFMRRSLRLGKKSSRRQPHSSNQSQNQNQNQLDSQTEPQEFRFSQFKTAAPDPKKLELVITAADRFRFGRRSTAVESILGFRVLPFPDQPECLMVDGFVHDLSALQHGIKRGDWFRSLNGIELYASNVDEILQQFVEPTQVCLGFQSCGSASAVSPSDPGYNPNLQDEQVCKVENFAVFTERFEQMLIAEGNSGSSENSPDIGLPFAMLLLPPECYQHEQQQDSLYYFPETPDNFLFKARGSFLTLHAVLSELHTQPLSSRLLVDQVQYHVNYRRLNGFLVLFAYAGGLCSAAECILRSDELIGYIRFSLPGLVLESFNQEGEGEAGNSSGLKQFLRHFCEIQRTRLLARCRGHIRFEELLGLSRSLPLPKEAQLRIFDALSEMEAMDYRNWNDEPLTTHREFFIYGSALYFDGFLVASLLPPEVRVSVEGFLRCRGIFELLGAAPGIRVREMYVWEEIVLPSATGRYFLTICTRNHLSLAVILKIFDAPDMAPDAVVGPSLFYIEEIQETLDHLVQCGIESLAMFWSVSNKRPEVLEATAGESRDPEKEPNSRLESFLKQKLTVLSNSVEEEAQLCSSLGGSSIHSLTPSDSQLHGAGEDSDSGSDWENFAVQHPLHYGLNLGAESHSQSQMTESMWKEINNVVPVKISAGWKNSVLHYVYIDIANGSLFAPFTDSSESSSFLSEIRQACHIIHAVLEKSKHYRRQLSESSRAPTSSNGHSGHSHAVSLVKEHGMTLEVCSPSKTEGQVQSQSQMQSSKSSRFVVVGRLFQSPAKEVYVCHRSDVPQNIVEMAFRLSFFSMG